MCSPGGANDWASGQDNPLYNAYDDLYWAAQTLPDDYTVAEDMDVLHRELSAFPAGFHHTLDGPGGSSDDP